MENLKDEQKEAKSRKIRVEKHTAEMKKTITNMESYMNEVEALIDKSDNELAKHYEKLEEKKRRTQRSNRLDLLLQQKEQQLLSEEQRTKVKDKQDELLKKRQEEAKRLANYNEKMRKKVEADMLLQIMEQEGEVEQMRQSMVSPSDGMTAGMKRNTDFDADVLEALGQNDINEFLEDNQMPEMEN